MTNRRRGSHHPSDLANIALAFDFDKPNFELPDLPDPQAVVSKPCATAPLTDGVDVPPEAPHAELRSLHLRLPRADRLRLRAARARRRLQQPRLDPGGAPGGRQLMRFSLMQEPIRRQFGIATLLILLVALATLGAAPLAWGQEEPDPSTLLDEDAALQELAAQSYATEYGVSLDEANRRLAIQDRAAGLDSELSAALQSAYAGMWFSAADAGRLKIGVATEPYFSAQPRSFEPPDIEEAKKLVAARGLQDQASFVSVTSSLTALIEEHEYLDDSLAALLSSGKIRTSVDTSTNAIVVETTASLSQSDRDQIDAAAADSLVSVQVITTTATSMTATADACNLPFCDRPLRGGVRVSISSGPACTAGFMAVSRVDSVRYVLTAGHCLANDSRTWDTKTSSGTLYSIGARHNWRFPGEDDAGIIRINQSSHWLTSSSPGPYVVVDTSPAPTTYDPRYTINNESYSSVGQTLCRSSGFSFGNDEYTRCGTVTRLDVSVSYPAGTVRHLGETNMCGLSGSSGGPYYKTHLAYGVHSGATSSGACRTFYQSAIRAENAMNVNILHG